jgi:hypothetical protein
MYIFLDHLNTNGNRTTFDTNIEINETLILDLNITKDTIKAAILSATFNP